MHWMFRESPEPRRDLHAFSHPGEPAHAAKTQGLGVKAQGAGQLSCIPGQVMPDILEWLAS